MRKRPLLLLLCMFLAGIFSRLGVWPLCLLLPPCLLAAADWDAKGWERWFMPTLCIFLFAAGAMRAESELRFRAAYLPELSDGEDIRLAGKLVRIEEKQRCVYYYLADCVIDRPNGRVPCSDVLAYASTDEYSVGQILVVRGTISLFAPAANEGGFDAERHYGSQKIGFGVWVDEVESAAGEKSRYVCFLAGLRARFADSMNACGAKGGILAAMLLGEKAELDGEVRSLYQQAGISHILAISGLHVSLLCVSLYRLLRRFLRYATAAAGTAIFALSYAVMTGGSVSTRRAVLMLLICLAADILGQGYDMLSALAFSCIALLWDNPFLIGSAGFLFSVAAVLGVGVSAPVLVAWSESFDAAFDSGICPRGRREAAARREKRMRAMRASLFTSLGIQLATLPLTAFYYYEIPVYAVLLNLLVLALVKYVVILGGLAALVGLFSVPCGTILILPCNLLLALYERLCQGALALPGARLVTGCPGAGRVAAYYALLGLVLAVMHRRTLVRAARAKEGRAACE